MRGIGLSCSPGTSHGLCPPSQNAHCWVYKLQIQWEEQKLVKNPLKIRVWGVDSVSSAYYDTSELSVFSTSSFLPFLKAFSWASLDFCHTWPYFKLSCRIVPPLSPLQLSSPPPPAHACDLHPSHLPCIVPHPSPFCIYLFICLPWGWKWGKNKNKYANAREKTERNLIKMCVFLSLRVL